MNDILKKLWGLEIDAVDFGFKWENPLQIMDQIQDECREVKEHFPDLADPTSKQKLQEEIGDLLHAVFSLCIFCHFDPEQTLEKSVNKFERRLNAVKQIAKTKGLSSLEGFTFEELMSYWRKAKELVG